MIGHTNQAFDNLPHIREVTIIMNFFLAISKDKIKIKSTDNYNSYFYEYLNLLIFLYFNEMLI